MGKNKGLKWYHGKIDKTSKEITDKKHRRKEKTNENNISWLPFPEQLIALSNQLRGRVNFICMHDASIQNKYALKNAIKRCVNTYPSTDVLQKNYNKITLISQPYTKRKRTLTRFLRSAFVRMVHTAF